MKKLLAGFALCVYLVPASVFLAISAMLSQEELDFAGFGALVLPVIMMLMVSALVVANIVIAIVFAARSKCLSFRAVMGFKLALIPFYIVNFLCWGIASAVFHIALVVWPLIPFIIAYTYFTVIGTSVYNVAHLILLRRNKKISTGRCVVHCIWQFIFVADVIDSVYLAIRQKKLSLQQPILRQK